MIFRVTASKTQYDTRIQAHHHATTITTCKAIPGGRHKWRITGTRTRTPAAFPAQRPDLHNRVTQNTPTIRPGRDPLHPDDAHPTNTACPGRLVTRDTSPPSNTRPDQDSSKVIGVGYPYTIDSKLADPRLRHVCCFLGAAYRGLPTLIIRCCQP